jgi:AcrR family transcriptional regulator
MPVITGRPSEARERLLRTASAIFYAEGIHNIGVDQILAAAAVTRSTFYRHFPSKESLVVAYIQAADAGLRKAVLAADDGHREPEELLRGLTESMGTVICQPGFRGCLFINAAAEYPDPASPVHRAVLDHREWLRSTVVDLLQRTGHAEPDQAARHFMMLRDGAMVGGYLSDPDQARQTLQRGVDVLLTTG